MYSSIAAATFLEWNTASTTVFAPLTTSPEANTPSLVVWPSVSVSTRPPLAVCMPVVVDTILSFGPWLMAMMVEAAGKSSAVSLW